MEIDNDTPTAALLDIIGWSAGTFAYRTGVNIRTAQRWKNRQNKTPGPIHNWLLVLAMAHLTHPNPQGWTPQD